MGQPLRHMEQLLLVTSCDSPAGIGASLRTHGRMHTGRMDGWTDRRDFGNSILDSCYKNVHNMVRQYSCTCCVLFIQESKH